MRIGILGLGRIGAFHTATLAGLDAVDSLVVTDPVAGAAAAAVERFGATAVDTPEAVLAAGVDGIVVAAATDAHPALILAAVEAGTPVFCEKPVARTVEESVAVLRAVQDSGVEVHIGYNRRFDAGCMAARKAVVSGELGKLHTVRSTTLDPAPPPAAYVAVSGGIFRDCAVHDFDIVRWVTGREVVEVYAAAWQPRGRVHRRGGRRRHRVRDPHPRRRNPRAGVQLAPQRPRLRRPPGTARHARQHRRGPGGQTPPALGGTWCHLPHAAPRTTSSWTASPPPTAPN